MTDELKPCPFCGSNKATIEPIFGASFDTPRYCVICSDCGADSQVDLGKSGAVECWNTRPREDAQQARITELELRLDAYNGNMMDVLEDENRKLKERVKELEDNIAAFYVVKPTIGNSTGIVIERCLQYDDSNKWAIRSGISCMDKEGDWVLEPMPSDRDTDFLQYCRWDTLDEAIKFAREHVDRGEE